MSELAAEFAKVDADLTARTAVQSQAATNDVVAVVLVGLPLDSMTSRDPKVRESVIARLKGEKRALQEAQRAAGCLG